jgi:hypothetical protein
MVKEKFGDAAYSEAKIDGWLENLVGRGLMYREENRYLSLATRSRWAQPTVKFVRNF